MGAKWCKNQPSEAGTCHAFPGFGVIPYDVFLARTRVAEVYLSTNKAYILKNAKGWYSADDKHILQKQGLNLMDELHQLQAEAEKQSVHGGVEI